MNIEFAFEKPNSLFHFFKKKLICLNHHNYYNLLFCHILQVEQWCPKNLKYGKEHKEEEICTVPSDPGFPQCADKVKVQL